MKGVLKEAVSSRKGIVLAPKDCAVGQRQALEELEVMLPDRVTDIDRATRDGP